MLPMAVGMKAGRESGTMKGSGAPTLTFTTPFRPRAPAVLSLSLMLMMPLMPSGSYLAEGLVMTSTFSTVEAGICSSNDARSLLSSSLGRPLTNTLTLLEPRSVTLPSLSTATLGTCSSTSVAVPPLLTIFLSTLMTRLSNWYSTIERSAVTSTASIIVPLILSGTFPTFTSRCLSFSTTTLP